MNAVTIVNKLLETGEADQNFEHGPWDALIAELDEAGIHGAYCKEFDKYQGVYLFVPRIGKFWCKEDNGQFMILYPERDPDKEFLIDYFSQGYQDTDWFVHAEEFMEYCMHKAHDLVMQDIADKAVSSVMGNEPKNPKPRQKASIMPMPPVIGRSGIGQAGSRFPSR